MSGQCLGPILFIMAVIITFVGPLVYLFFANSLLLIIKDFIAIDYPQVLQRQFFKIMIIAYWCVVGISYLFFWWKLELYHWLFVNWFGSKVVLLGVLTLGVLHWGLIGFFNTACLQRKSSLAKSLKIIIALSGCIVFWFMIYLLKTIPDHYTQIVTFSIVLFLIPISLDGFYWGLDAFGGVKKKAIREQKKSVLGIIQLFFGLIGLIFFGGALIVAIKVLVGALG